VPRRNAQAPLANPIGKKRKQNRRTPGGAAAITT
jgi:hypothetical protein